MKAAFRTQGNGRKCVKVKNGVENEKRAHRVPQIPKSWHIQHLRPETPGTIGHSRAGEGTVGHSPAQLGRAWQNLAESGSCLHCRACPGRVFGALRRGGRSCMRSCAKTPCKAAGRIYNRRVPDGYSP